MEVQLVIEKCISFAISKEKAIGGDMGKHLEVPKAPRWINSEAGIWAWNEVVQWRKKAAVAFSVADRSRLLDEAVKLYANVTLPAAA
jgi:hypothetical protein